MIYLLTAFVIIAVAAVIAHYQARQFDKEYKHLLKHDPATAEALMQAHLHTIFFI